MCEDGAHYLAVLGCTWQRLSPGMHPDRPVALLPKVWDQMLEDGVEPNDDSRAVLLRTCPPMDQIAHRWPSGSVTPGSSASSTQQQVGFWPAPLTSSSCKLCQM